MIAVEKRQIDNGFSITHPLRSVKRRWRRLRRQLEDPLVRNPMVLIYQMPKAGSQTIEATLQQRQLPHSIFRFHFLSESRASFIREEIQSKKRGEQWEYYARMQLELRENLTKVLRLRKLLRYFRSDIPKISVITGLRDPISLVLSGLFQNHSSHFCNPEEITPEACRELMLRTQTFTFIEEWFDKELKTNIGVDVYRKPFPREQGYVIFENHWARVLVYRFEALRILPGVLREFLGCEVSKLADRNIGSAKEYSAQYAHVKKHLRLPADFVNAHCNTKMVNHFYSLEERQQMMQRWTEPQPVPA